MVSIEPLRYFTEQIAGDIFQVESIVPDGYNPESYKPTPKQLMLLVDCQAFISCPLASSAPTSARAVLKKHARNNRG